MSVFGKNQGPTNKVKRNAFDLSFQNHLTFNFGQLVPCFCKEVIPGDTFEIDSAFGLNFLPTAFPVQSKINANIHYFYVRNRTLWKDWYDYYFGTKDGLVSPYLDREVMLKRSQLHSSSLLDYFGIPTAFSGVQEVSQDVTEVIGISNSDWVLHSSVNNLGHILHPLVGMCNSPFDGAASSYLLHGYYDDNPDFSLGSAVKTHITKGVDSFISADGSSCVGYSNSSVPNGTLRTLVPWSTFVGGTHVLKMLNNCHSGSGFLNMYSIPFKLVFSSSVPGAFDLELTLSETSLLSDIKSATLFYSAATEIGSPIEFFTGAPFVDLDMSKVVVEDDDVNGYTRVYFRGLNLSSDGFLLPPDFKGFCYCCLMFTVRNPVSLQSYSGYGYVNRQDVVDNDNYFGLSFPHDNLPLRAVYYPDVYSDVSDAPDSVASPFGSDVVPISALPFRAYEMIYNSFYRDARNNPYVVDGEVQYNQFIPTIEGGKDSNFYPLRYRNWEYDFLTTCQPTPQFGNAPLVGITAAGKMTFVASEDGQEYKVQAEVGDDGSSISSVSYSENIPNSVARSLVDVVSSGISINDFRNVNSFQRFLETTMRRGLKAVDLLKAHFDVNASYNALDMPEFIGGISTVVDAQKINNLNGDGSAPLGDYAGQLTCIGNQRHKVRCYCDEPGFIIGIVCVHPVPLYSQLLPKHFLKRSNLDYFFPQFGHIGLQPVLMREVAPLQVANDSETAQTDVFGYQRAWYDYLSSVDEVHGLFRTQLRDYVLNRVFNSVPKLSPDFTVINPQHLNDIFTVQDISDKILGKIVFNVKAVRPIPKYGIPKID